MAGKYLDSKGSYVQGKVHFEAGHYQRLVLDVRRGEFYFHCDDWRVPRGLRRNDRFPPSNGLWAPFHWLRVADVLSWTIDSHHTFEQRPYLTREEGNAFAREVAPLAESLLRNLQPVPGTGVFDWSAESASAGMDIQAVCSRHRYPPRGRRPELVNMTEAVSVCPQLIQDRWANLDDKHLNEEAEGLNRFGLHSNPAITEALGIDPDTDGASLVGTRAWLYEYRVTAAAGRPMRSAASFFPTHPELVTAETTTAELRAMPAKARAAAEAEGIVLLGDTAHAADARRTQLRKKVLDELATRSEVHSEAEATVKSRRYAVYAYLYRALSWEARQSGEPAVSDARLAELAHLNDHIVARLRAQLNQEITEERDCGQKWQECDRK
ncbi:hypothetical protein AB0E08_46610 [Streptomyces sp. NPDC048281]|uniref:hypothetical protein n=1 Tax=Streptomyces sp. NPDC048281 TaxID=3154715 RepID=UPI0034328431